MWLGSRFCAGHILRHTDTLTDIPAFWTREQRGEEASTSLLFAHKYAVRACTSAMVVSGTGDVASTTPGAELRRTSKMCAHCHGG